MYKNVLIEFVSPLRVQLIILFGYIGMLQQIQLKQDLEERQVTKGAWPFASCTRAARCALSAPICLLVSRRSTIATVTTMKSPAKSASQW